MDLVERPPTPDSSRVTICARETTDAARRAPLRGALVLGADCATALWERIEKLLKDVFSGSVPVPAAPAFADLRATERLAIDYGNAADLADKATKAQRVLKAETPGAWKALRAQGIFRGHGPAGKVAFLYSGQGSQYVNMLRTLRDAEPIVDATFAEADRVMKPLLGQALSGVLYVDASDAEAVAKAEKDLLDTAVMQPAVLAADIALTRLLAEYGISADMTMGHSLGEYAALVAAGALRFDEALETVAARGQEAARVQIEDHGKMAAVFAPVGDVERILKMVDGYVQIANLNSNRQAVIGGASSAVEQAADLLVAAGYDTVALPVSHAFHTSVVAPLTDPLSSLLRHMRLQSPRVPVVGNLHGEFYPMGPECVPEMMEILGQQMASPVQFVRGLRTLYDAGARVFIEVGPKKALQGFAEDVLGGEPDVVSLFTNHPKFDDIVAFNQALCGLYAAGIGDRLPGALD